MSLPPPPADRTPRFLPPPDIAEDEEEVDDDFDDVDIPPPLPPQVHSHGVLYLHLTLFELNSTISKESFSGKRRRCRWKWSSQVPVLCLTVA